MRYDTDNENGRERRRYKRTHVLFSGSLVSGARVVEGVVLDLSAGGARIQFAEPIVIDSETTLRLADLVDFDVSVAWIHDKCLGLKFRETPARVSSLFAGLLPENCLAAA